ncbi:MAG: hypothetical protein BWZ07_00099 [Alphaproteobacteria bacterium ADurb.BinA280]|jgi:hypothetical protein|nr:hypothetical protein [Aquimonas sp.]OPZ13993.1 MAG: hypothetical protein BWZ07_00099 [Alphaproteobacteria bacterium ADurb.BinA280]
MAARQVGVGSWLRVFGLTAALGGIVALAVFVPVAWQFWHESRDSGLEGLANDATAWRHDISVEAVAKCLPTEVLQVWAGEPHVFGERTPYPLNSIQLRVGELPLWCGRGAETYRLTYVPTFDNPILVRVWFDGDVGLLSATRFEGEGGYQIGDPKAQAKRDLSPQEVTRLRALVEAVGFWSPIRYRPREGLDGSTWIFEGRRDGHYQQLVRWSPEAGAERDFGLALIRLSGLTTASDDVY